VLPEKERFEWARNVVREALDSLLGSEGIGYTVEKRADGKKWITTGPGQTGPAGQAGTQ
jgi:hypothetical protein